MTKPIATRTNHKGNSTCNNVCAQLFHTQLFYTKLCHIHLFHTHTQSFTHSFVTYNSFTRLCTQTCTRNTVTHGSFTQPVLHHLFSFLPFPSHFLICLVIIRRNWYVGLSGPLIFRGVGIPPTSKIQFIYISVYLIHLMGIEVIKKI
jgi:hypothetical protein